MSRATRLHGQLLSAAGLWLLLAPFILFSQSSLSTGRSAEAALVSMSIGMSALLVAGLNERKALMLRAATGVALGLAAVASPWVFGFADQLLAAFNACIIGISIALIAGAEVLSGRNRHNHS